MDTCMVCEKIPANIVCPCGEFQFCSNDCLTKSNHIKTCDPKRIDIRLYNSVIYHLEPIITTAEKDTVLLDLLKNARKHCILKMYEQVTSTKE